MYGEEEGAYRVLMGKPEELLRRQTPRFEDNIKLDFQIV